VYRIQTKNNVQELPALGRKVVEEDGKKYPARQCKGCAEHKQSETTHMCKFCVVPLHKGSYFEKHHSLKNYWTFCTQFCQYRVQEFHLYSQIVRIYLVAFCLHILLYHMAALMLWSFTFVFL
jgi:hypothetical protein